MELPIIIVLFGLATAVGLSNKSWLAGLAVLFGIPLGLWLVFTGWEALELCIIIFRASRLRGSRKGIELLRDNGYRLHEMPWFRRRAAKLLAEAVAHPELPLRFIAAQGLCRMQSGAELAVPVLTEALADTELRGDALGDLRTLGPTSAAAMPALMRLLPDRRDPNWWQVARTLEAIGPAAVEAVPALIDAMGASSVDEVDWPARALGAIGDPRAIPALEKLLKEGRDERARDSAKRALARLQA